jgi:hypothetical protein
MVFVLIGLKRKLKQRRTDKMKANPLGELEMEIIADKTNVSSQGSMEGYDNYMRDQTPVLKGLAAQDTFAADESTPTSRADVELRRMHVGKGIDTKGANMYTELGGGTGKQASDFSSNKTA